MADILLAAQASAIGGIMLAIAGGLVILGAAAAIAWAAGREERWRATKRGPDGR